MRAQKKSGGARGGTARIGRRQSANARPCLGQDRHSNGVTPTAKQESPWPAHVFLFLNLHVTGWLGVAVMVAVRVARFICPVGVQTRALKTQPPTIALFSNVDEPLHFSYRRYLENQFREELGLSGSPIRLVLRARKGMKRE